MFLSYDRYHYKVFEDHVASCKYCQKDYNAIKPASAKGASSIPQKRYPILTEKQTKLKELEKLIKGIY